MLLNYPKLPLPLMNQKISSLKFLTNLREELTTYIRKFKNHHIFLQVKPRTYKILTA